MGWFKYLIFLIFILISINLVTSEIEFGYDNDNQPKVIFEESSSTTTIINSSTSSNVTVNSTQFSSSDPITIKESWLTTFINTFGFITNLVGLTTDDLTEGSTNKYDNQSWNESLADTLYADISVTGGNSSFNQTLTDDLYVNIDGDTMTGNLNSTGNITANDFIIPDMTGNKEFTINHFFKDMTSAGRLTGGEIVDNGGTEVIITAGEGLLRDLDDDHSQVRYYEWVNSSPINIPTDSISYFGIDLNGGNPIVVNYSSDDNFDLDTSFPLGTVINQGGKLYILNNPWWVGDGLTNIIERFQAEGWLERDDEVGGLILGYTGTRNPTLSAGTLWSRLTEHEIPAFDASGADDFNYFYRDGAGSYSKIADQSQWNITHWDDGTGTLNDIGNNKYAVIWVWVNVGVNEISLIYPQATYSNAASAEAEAVPEFPAMWYKGGVIAGRIIIKEGEDVPVEIQTAFTTHFTAALAADHGNLAGLTDDDHPQYLMKSATSDLDMNGYSITEVGALMLDGAITSEDIIPKMDDIYNLGNSTRRFKSLYATLVVATDIYADYINTGDIESATGEIGSLQSNDINSSLITSETINGTDTNTENLTVGGSKVYVSDSVTYFKSVN